MSWERKKKKKRGTNEFKNCVTFAQRKIKQKKQQKKKSKKKSSNERKKKEKDQEKPNFTETLDPLGIL